MRETLSHLESTQLTVAPRRTNYMAAWTMSDGVPVTIRPIRLEDEPLMVKFHRTLSDESVYRRYFHMFPLGQRIAHERLARTCSTNYQRMALVADRTDSETGERQILGVGRLCKIPGTNDAEVALLVADSFQHRGLGTELLRRLIEIGKAEKLNGLTADILTENAEMHRICEKLGFRLCREIGDPTIKAILRLESRTPR